ncbi:MAG: hypothetical protein IT433_05680 [Phycisphaerales bacterium]|nr:hypothetical protein [Phycisphaerales bacterium]
MEGVRPWHIVLFVAAAIALGLGLFWQLRSGDQIEKATTVVIVDVATGDLYECDRPSGGGLLFPLKNPETQKALMLPAEREGEVWKVSARYLPLAVSLAEKESGEVALNKATGQVKVKSPEPIKRKLAEK